MREVCFEYIVVPLTVVRIAGDGILFLLILSELAIRDAHVDLIFSPTCLYLTRA